MAKQFGAISRWLKDYQIISRYRQQWFFALLFLLLAAGATLAVPIAFRDLVDAGITSDAINAKFLNLLLLAVFLAVVTASRFYLMSWLGERVVADIRDRVFANMLRQSPAYFETLRTGEVLSRLTSDTTLIQALIGTSVSVALRSGVMFLGALLMMLATSAWLAGIMLMLLIAVVLPLWALGRQVRKMSRASQDKVADTSALAGEVLNAMPTVQAFVRESYEQARFSNAVRDTFEQACQRIRFRSGLTAAAITLAFSVIVFVLWMGVRQVSSGGLSLGELTQFVMYAVLVAGSLGALSEVWGDVQRAAGATERLVELMQAEPQIQDGAVGGSSLLVMPDLKSTTVIEFNQVDFSYPSRPEMLALNQLSFSVKASSRTALVGPSGAGKTTVLSLLLRFYAHARGQIKIFGHDVSDWPLDELRKKIAIVPQEPVIFAASAIDNIRYGRLDATDQEVLAAAKSAHADGFISALPQGYDTFLGERGVRLSGGQRQRISLARAILKNPPILLLDEATSSLDAESEREVQRALDEILPGRTSLTIAHRLATVLRADQIVVMDAGQVVESGTHTSLLADNGLYARLAKLQFV